MMKLITGLSPCPPDVDCDNLPDDAVVTSSNKAEVVKQVDYAIGFLAKDGRSSASLDNPNAAAEAYEQSRIGGTGASKTFLKDFIISDDVTIEVTQQYDSSTLEYAETIATDDELSTTTNSSNESNSSISGNIKGSGSRGPVKIEAGVEGSSDSKNSSSNSGSRSMNSQGTKTHVYNADIITITRVTIQFNFEKPISNKVTTRSRGSFRTRNRVSIKPKLKLKK